MHDNVIVKEEFNAPLEQVWAAITDQQKMKQWYFDIPDFKAEPNTEFNFYAGDDNIKYQHHCEILEVLPQEKLKHTWAYPEISKDKTIVKWELVENAGKTTLTLTHKGIENFNHLGENFSHQSFQKGWTSLLTDSLKNYLKA